MAVSPSTLLSPSANRRRLSYCCIPHVRHCPLLLVALRSPLFIYLFIVPFWLRWNVCGPELLSGFSRGALGWICTVAGTLKVLLGYSKFWVWLKHGNIVVPLLFLSVTKYSRVFLESLCDFHRAQVFLLYWGRVCWSWILSYGALMILLLTILRG